MSQEYRIDRLNLVSHKWQKKKELSDLRCRYLAKSVVVNCKAQGKNYDFVNWRGSIFSRMKFKTVCFRGCDFIGTHFNSCQFENVRFEDCTFVACKFKKCTCEDAVFQNSIIVNTTLPPAAKVDNGEILKAIPKIPIEYDLYIALESLHDNPTLKKNKLLFLGDKKYNNLNLYLLQKRFGNNLLPTLFLLLNGISTRTLTTYKKLEITLRKLKNDGTMLVSRPTQSRG